VIKEMEKQIFNIPIDELTKYLTQYDVCALVLVSKGTREIFIPLYKKIREFFIAESNKLTLYYESQNPSIFYKYTLTNRRKVLKEKDVIYFTRDHNCVNEPFRDATEREKFPIRNGDIVETLGKKFTKSEKMESNSNIYYYKDGELIHLNQMFYGGRDIMMSTDLFPLNKFSYFYWSNIGTPYRFSINEKEMIIYWDKSGFIKYIEVLTKEFKYSIKCSKKLSYNARRSQRVVVFINYSTKGYQISNITPVL